MHSIHDAHDLHHGSGGRIFCVFRETHGASDVAAEFRHLEINIDFVAGFAEIAKENKVRYLRMVKQIIHHLVDGDVQSFLQGAAVHDFFHLEKLSSQIVVHVHDDGFIQVVFVAPVVMKGGDIDSHFFGDHPGGGSVEAVFTKKTAGNGKNSCLHGFRILTGLFKG